jgi:hypothetical protein
VVSSCQAATPPKWRPATPEIPAVACSGGSLTLDSPALPNPLAAADNLACAWDIFAWNSFAALNWPADPDRRGFPHPDRGKTFKKPAVRRPPSR